MSLRTLGETALRAALLFGCDGAAEETAGRDVKAGLPWDQGGEDIPEYSLGRLLVSDASASRVTVFDLDSESVAGTLELGPGAQVMAGSNGRYSYVHDRAAGVLHVVDPGQWLLSHIDHFHVVKSELGPRDEQLEIGALTSFVSHEGWIALVDAERGGVTAFQERSLTAMAFAPITIRTEPHRGVALVSHAHVFMSEPSEDGAWGIGVRDVVDSGLRKQHVAGCSAPNSIAAEGDLVYVACEEGLLSLRWVDAGAAELEVDLFTDEAAGFAPRTVRTNAGLGAVLFDRGDARLMSRDQRGASRALSFESDILDIQIRRQGTAALVLTADGMLHEVRLPALELDRALQVSEPHAGSEQPPRFVLSHAYAYIADARTSGVKAVRLSTMEIERVLPLDGAPVDVATAGLPFAYTDDRE